MPAYVWVHVPILKLWSASIRHMGQELETRKARRAGRAGRNIHITLTLVSFASSQ